MTVMIGMSGQERNRASGVPQRAESAEELRDVPVEEIGEAQKKVNEEIRRRTVLQFEYASEILKTGDIATDLWLWTNKPADGTSSLAEIFSNAWEAARDEKGVVNEALVEEGLRKANVVGVAQKLKNSLEKQA